MNGDALAMIIHFEPALTTGIVTFKRSRGGWYAATPWSGAVTGAHPIAVINQAFLPKGTFGDTELLDLFTEMRRFETVEIERRADGLVRITVRNAVRGCSAWPNMNGEELSPENLDAHYHAKRLEMYPLGPELKRTVGFAARWVSDQEHLDDYEMQLLRGWARRWLRQQRRLAGDPGPEVWDPAIEAHVERLAGILRIEPDLARRLAVPPTRLAAVEETHATNPIHTRRGSTEHR